MLSLDFKRRIDTVVGTPLLSLLGIAARFLGFVLNRSHRKQPVNTILVLKFQGIGSLALAAPHVVRLKTEFPNARLIFWGSPATASFANTLDIWSEIHVLDDSSVVRSIVSICRTLVHLMRIRVDWAFDLEVYSKLSSILLTLSCARNRVGFAASAVPGRFHIHTTLIHFNRYRHVGDSYQNLLAILLAPSPKTPNSDLSLPWKFVLSPAETLGGSIAVHGRYAVINANVGELAIERAWPEESFQALISKIEIASPELQIVLIGKGAKEKLRNQRIAMAAPTKAKVVDLTDLLDLPNLIRVLKNAAFVISGDTGSLHLANLVRTPTIALFGPTLPQTYFSPDAHERSSIVEQSVFCRPCVHHWAKPPCNGDNLCMKSISVDQVFRAIGEPNPRRPEFPMHIQPGTPSSGVVYQRPIF